MPLTKDVGTGTPTHFVESFIDINYHWNEWELRRRALQIVNLKGMEADFSLQHLISGLNLLLLLLYRLYHHCSADGRVALQEDPGDAGLPGEGQRYVPLGVRTGVARSCLYLLLLLLLLL